MFNFTYENHLKYFIDSRKYGYRQNGIEKYEVEIGSVDFDHYKKNNYKSELARIADLISKDFGRDFVLFLSGGTDSEIVLRSFLDIGIKPRCCTIKFEEDYNHQDVLESIEVAKELDVPLEILDFNIKNFYYSGEAESFAKEIQCTQLTYLMIYYHVYKLSAPAVMGGELLLTRSINKDSNYWYYTFRENEDASAMRFSNRFKIPLVNEYFSYTPEIMLYFLESNFGVKQMLDNRHKLSSVSSKNDILEKIYPQIRKKIKTHGFEKLLAFNYECYKDILKDEYRRLEPSLDGIPLDITLRKLKNEY
jgi:hypothetical protein